MRSTRLSARRARRQRLRCCVRSTSRPSWSTYLMPMRWPGGRDGAARCHHPSAHRPADRAGHAGYPAAQEANRRLRIEGTRNLMQAARMAGVRRVVAQSIAFVYAPATGRVLKTIRSTSQPRASRQLTVQGIVALEREVLQTLRHRRRRAALRLSLRAGDLVRRCRRSRRRSMSMPPRRPRCWR